MNILETKNIDKYFHDPVEFQVLKNIDLITSKMQLLILGDVEAFKRAISV